MLAGSLTGLLSGCVVLDAELVKTDVPLLVMTHGHRGMITRRITSDHSITR